MPISSVACIISASSPDKPGVCLFIFLNAAATSSILMQSAGASLINSSWYMIPFILFIHQFFFVLLPQIFNPLLVYNHFTQYSHQIVWPCYIPSFFYHLLCYSKVSFWWLGSFKSLLLYNRSFICMKSLICDRHVEEASLTSMSSAGPMDDSAEAWQPCSDPHKMLCEAQRLLSNEDW